MAISFTLRALTTSATAAVLTVTVAPLAGSADAATHARARIVASGWATPDTKATPGDVATTSAKKVCTKGYASSVRHVTQSTKNKVYAKYGITSHVAYQYEIDHDISLELGGSNSIKNLWPEPNDKKTSNSKDTLENKLHSLVCSGQLSLKAAQKAIRGDWTKAYTKYVGNLPKYKAYHHTGSTSSSSGGSSSTGSGGGTDPRFDYCYEAQAAGYGPYFRGTDPEYYWYRDADGDGEVCE